jgi:hypothetical protein
MTIKQKTTFIEIEGGKRIEVRRMRWRAMRDFLRKLGAIVATFKKSSPDEKLGAVIFARLPELVEGSDELITLLCTESTGLSLDDFGNLDALSASAVLAAALEINCDDEIKNSLAGIAKSVAGLIPIQPPALTPAPDKPTTTT